MDRCLAYGLAVPAISRRWLLAIITVLFLLGGSGWMAPEPAAAGQAGTIVVDGAPLFVDHDDYTVIEWMDEGTRVDYFYGPYEWMYQIRYYDTVGWTWMENVVIDGQGGVADTSGGGGGGTGGATDTSQVANLERWVDINRSTGAVTLYEGDTPLNTFYASLSRSQGEDFYATASGTYYVYAMNASLTYTPFAKAYITHWVGFDPDRRNGFHSYTKDANGNITANGAGYTGGCVALAPGGIEALYDFSFIGMRVEVHW
jgi:hypothetical protein